MKAKALRKFKDMKKDLTIDEGSIFEITKKRFDELNSTSWGTIVEEVKEVTKKDE